ncbi:MAG: protease modulator HflC [Treponemataceae bacterium]
MKKPLYILTGIAIFIVLFLMTGPLYIVNEGYQVVVTRLGKIVNTHVEAGLYIKVPFVDIVTTYPKRILSLDGDPQEILTREKQYLIVDTTNRWRISDPRLFYQSLKNIEQANIRLADIVDSAVRTVITQNRLSEVVRSSNIINERANGMGSEDLLADTEDETASIEAFVNVSSDLEMVSKGRRQLSLEMAEHARMILPNFGIELLDVVPRQIKYSDELTESIYNRMIKERNQVAQAYRSFGEGKKAEWLGKLENEKRAVLSDAYKRAEEIKGNADATATNIYAKSYSQDTEFYTFWKSIESYRKTIPNFDTTLSTDLQYFKYLYSSNGR